MVILRIFVGLIVMGAPCAFAVWIGTRVRRALLAFFLAWATTPIVTGAFVLLLWPVFRVITPPENDGTMVIMIPFFGIVTGLVAGIVAAVIVNRRRRSGSMG